MVIASKGFCFLLQDVNSKLVACMKLLSKRQAQVQSMSRNVCFWSWKPVHDKWPLNISNSNLSGQMTFQPVYQSVNMEAPYRSLVFITTHCFLSGVFFLMVDKPSQGFSQPFLQETWFIVYHIQCCQVIVFEFYINKEFQDRGLLKSYLNGAQTIAI